MRRTLLVYGANLQPVVWRAAGRAPGLRCTPARADPGAAGGKGLPCRPSCCRTRRRSCCPCCSCGLSACARWAPAHLTPSFAGDKVLDFLPRTVVRMPLPAAHPPVGAAELGRAWQERARACLCGRADHRRAARGVPRGLQGDCAGVPGPGALCCGGAARAGRAMCAPPCLRTILLIVGRPRQLCASGCTAASVVSDSRACVACLLLLQASICRGTRAMTGVRRLPWARCMRTSTPSSDDMHAHHTASLYTVNIRPGTPARRRCPARRALPRSGQPSGHRNGQHRRQKQPPSGRPVQ